MNPDRLEGDGFKVGANPFSHGDYVDVFRERALEAEYFRTHVTGTVPGLRAPNDRRILSARRR